MGNAGVRNGLHDAANALLTRATKFSTFKRWAIDVAKRRGTRRAKMALARRLATACNRHICAGAIHIQRADGLRWIVGRSMISERLP